MLCNSVEEGVGDDVATYSIFARLYTTESDEADTLPPPKQLKQSRNRELRRELSIPESIESIESTEGESTPPPPRRCHRIILSDNDDDEEEVLGGLPNGR